MKEEQILDWLDKNNRGFTQKDFELFKKFYKEATKELQEENGELKRKIGLSVDCDKAEKHGELCLGYGGDEDEPCEQCKNCIKCETGYYQLGETNDLLTNRLNEATETIRALYYCLKNYDKTVLCGELITAISEAEAFLKE